MKTRLRKLKKGGFDEAGDKILKRGLHGPGQGSLPH